MKKLLCCLVLVSLVSCGKSSQKKSENEAESIHESKFAPEFGLPKINFQRSITIDPEITTDYEKMTVNPSEEYKVLGDRAFYVDVFDDRNEIDFYNSTAVKSIKYFDNVNPAANINITKQQLQMLKLKEVKLLMKNGLAWGIKNIDNPEYDMQNKAYVIRTEEMKLGEQNDQIEYKSASTYLMWFECQGEVKQVKELSYSCGKYNLKFHYKLLDYTLTWEKI